MNRQDCTHGRQVVIADTGVWVCQDCGVLIDPNDPSRIQGTEEEVREDQERVRRLLIEQSPRIISE